MLTPEQIESREFLVSLRGYDRDEVHAFLNEVAETVRGLAKGSGAVVTGSDPSEVFAQIASETQRILEAAQEAGEDIKRRAHQEADREIKQARTRASKLIADGERRRERLEADLVEMQKARDALADSLRGVGRSLEQALRGLLTDEPATSVREALRVDESSAEQAAEEAPPEPATAQASPAEEPPVDEVGEQQVPALSAEPAISVEPSAEQDEDVPAHTGPAAEAGTPVSEEPGQAQALRSQALSPLHPKLVRKIKRGLQDMQNAALDRLRRSGGGEDPGDYVPTDEETRIVGLMASEFLDEAYTAGVAAAGELAGRPLGEPNEPRSLDVEFVEDVTERIRQPLAATLRMALTSGQSAGDLNDRMGTVFAELKGAVAEELAATHLIRAYESGLLDTWAAGGIVARRWVLGREPRCPEARCRANDQVGDVPVSDDFPSGHRQPPVHPGCNCTTIPAGA